MMQLILLKIDMIVNKMLLKLCTGCVIDNFGSPAIGEGSPDIGETLPKFR